MTPTFRGLFAAMLMCLSAAAFAADGEIILDQGRFIVFQDDKPVAVEHFQYTRMGDSVVVAAQIDRRVRDSAGELKPFVKRIQLTADALDYGLRGYSSVQEFEGVSTVKGVMPGDTSMTVYSEVGESGTADRLVQPPGRVFIMDPLVFTLFDVICRNLSPQSFTKRPINLVTLGPSSTTTEATAMAAGADTVTWGGKRVIARRFVLTDATSRFTLWVNAQGQMLRLEHDGGGLAVMREEPEVVKPAKATKPAPKRTPKKS